MSISHRGPGVEACDRRLPGPRQAVALRTTRPRARSFGQLPPSCRPGGCDGPSWACASPSWACITCWRSWEEPVLSVHEPALSVHEPVLSVREPTLSVDNPLAQVERPTLSVREPAVSVNSPGLFGRSLAMGRPAKAGRDCRGPSPGPELPFR